MDRKACVNPGPAGPAFSPVEAVAGPLDAGVLVICDHASNALPPDYGSLGLKREALARHIAYDIGAASLARALASRLNAPAVLSTFSRLLIDPNRGADDPTLVMRYSDGAIVPGNARIDAAEIARRRERFWAPYLVPFDAAALPGAGRQPAVSGHLTSVVEAAKERFQPEERRELRAQTLELEELGGGVVPLLGLRADERVAGPFDRSQLHRHQRDPLELPAYFRLQHWRQLAAVAGSQRLEPFEKRIVIPDALAAEQALDPIGVPNAFLEQRAALARQPPAILILRARRANH